jgi:hypothetical protein
MHNCPGFAERVEIVKKRSTFYVDGSGLAFYLYRVAYARHTAQVLNRKSAGSGGGRRRSSSTSCQCSAKRLTPDQATKLLPNLLPLSRLDEVTREFVTTLQKKHHIILKIYFDGEFRREAKAFTDEERRRRRPSEWSALQQYCCNGVVPTVDKVCEWDREFPKNRFFIEQIKYTLRLLQVETVVCKEEADAELASMAAATPNSYVVGLDTDFCFFQSAKYIPLKTLHASDSVVTACIISREALATTLNLPDAHAMVELAILMRNDYVGSQDKVGFHAVDPDSILEHLRACGEGYRVTSKSEETQKALRFVRTFYNLGNLDEEFPLALKSAGENADEEEVTGPILKVPHDFPDHLAELQPGDTSLKGAVLRCLQAYVDQKKSQNTADKAMIRDEHLEAFRQMSSYQEDDNSSGWKPFWGDVPAAFLISSTILYVRRKTSPNNPLIRLSPPEKLFDEYKFHATMRKLRASIVPKSDEMSVANSKTPKPPGKTKSKQEPRLQLPVDEHEEKILGAISRNRVTIIQGKGITLSYLV